MADWQLWLVVGLIVVLLVLFIRETLPTAVTAILGTVVLMLSGVLDVEEGLSGLSNPATVTVLAMFILSAGVRRTGLVDALTNLILKWAGGRPRAQMAALGLTVGPISGILNNTAVVAVMMPSAFRLAERSDQPPSRLLIPLSTFAMLGGLLTVIGTSTNLLGNGLLPRFAVEPFAFFDFLPVGLAALALGIAYYVTVGFPMLPNRGRGDVVERFDLKGFFGEFDVPAGSPLAGTMLLEAGLVWPEGVQVIRVSRNGETHDAPSPSFWLRAGDRILVEASRQRLADLAEVGHLVPSQRGDEASGATSPDGTVTTAEVVITPGSRLGGRTVQELNFPGRYRVLVLAVRHHDRVAIGPPTESRVRPGDVLLVRGPEDAFDRMRELPDFVITRERQHPHRRSHLQLIALGILVAVVLAAALEWADVAVAAMAGAVAMVLAGCLRADEFVEAVEWDVILLLAGVIPLGIAVEKTGLAALLASGLTAYGGSLGVYGLLVLAFVVTTLITEVISNNASVALLIPIAVAAAAGVGIDPRPVCLVVIAAASTSMMTPIGYQTNTMVYAAGSYRFGDFFRSSALLNAALAVVLPYVVMTLYPAA